MKKRKISNPPKYCTGCNHILMEDEHNKDSEGNDYCNECKSKFEAITGSLIRILILNEIGGFACKRYNENRCCL